MDEVEVAGDDQVDRKRRGDGVVRMKRLRLRWLVRMWLTAKAEYEREW